MTALIDAAAVLGIFMVGALIASMIGVEVTGLHIGDKAVEIQDMLNLIFPFGTMSQVWLLVAWTRKGMNSTSYLAHPCA